jgi:uncharacterized membrane protein
VAFDGGVHCSENIMTSYLIVKWLHILTSVLLVGTGFGSAFYLFFANRSGSVAAQAVVARLVVRADTWFTTPAIILQPLTGFMLARWAGWPLSTPWIALSVWLYVLAGACWLPVVWMQVKMARMAETAAGNQTALPALYWQYAKRWEALGYPAFVAMVGIYYLMVNKPVLWA